MTDIDYGADAPKPAAVSDAMAEVEAIYHRALAVRDEVAAATETLRNATDRLRAIEEGELPALMERHGYTSFRMANGVSVTLEEKITNSIAAERRDQAYDWFEANDYGDIVKRELSVAFGVRQEKQTEALAKVIRDAGHEPVFKRVIAPATVKKIIVDRLADGREVPMDLLGVFKRKIASFSLNKPGSK